MLLGDAVVTGVVTHERELPGEDGNSLHEVASDRVGVGAVQQGDDLTDEQIGHESAGVAGVATMATIKVKKMSGEYVKCLDIGRRDRLSPSAGNDPVRQVVSPGECGLEGETALERLVGLTLGSPSKDRPDPLGGIDRRPGRFGIGGLRGEGAIGEPQFRECHGAAELPGDRLGHGCLDMVSGATATQPPVDARGTVAPSAVPLACVIELARKGCMSMAVAGGMQQRV
ncbi:hypothetical protein [Micromonospora sp. WMMD998]|uniref:hypothetical protein n=1 Tax=Micromonospora sp. WMMD998 TaxID=3016092 RepID=UPI00249C5D40|nr:hypothetical protein [Micromonospora sp. WMMD998]WFE40086.1 hypothetical protein O7619_17230 [Micromonospora sp. WMMD998]